MNDSTKHSTGCFPVLCFLILTFGITFGIQYMLIRDGIRFDGDVVRHTPILWLLVIMWIPGLAALVATRFDKNSHGLARSLGLRLGPLGPYCLVIVLVPALYAAMYAISWLLGLATPDFTMTSLNAVAGGREDVTAESVMQVYLPMSIFLGPFLHLLFSLGEEIGWRGFLLPRLMKYGKPAAYTATGVLWGLWHLPIILVGFNYPGHPLTGIAMMCLLTSAFGLFLNEMTLHYRSVLLAAFIHAAVNAQGFGIWQWLFKDVNPLLAGPTGLVGVGVWLATGIIAMAVLGRISKDARKKKPLS